MLPIEGTIPFDLQLSHMTEQELEQHNTLLRQELGSNPMGQGLYRWARAGELTYLGSTGERDWHRSEGGIFLPEPKFEVRKMAPELDDRQWVLLRWLENDAAEHVFQFGKCYYAYTNVSLWLDVEPTTCFKGQTFTQLVIGLINDQRKKKPAQMDAEFEDQYDRKLKQKQSKFKDQIGDACTAFLNPVPGSHGYHVEYGGVESESHVAQSGEPRSAHTVHELAQNSQTSPEAAA